MKIYHIYKITNLINNKIYIGQTTQSKVYERFNRHLSNARCGHDGFLYNAIRKYGKSSFTYELIFCALDMNSCNEMEIYFIDLFKSTNRQNGYNILIGGGQAPLPEASKIKLSQKLKEQFKNGRKNWNDGTAKLKIPVPKEVHRYNLSEAKKKYHRENEHHQSKLVICLETNEIFNSASKAARKYNTTVSMVSSVCRGKKPKYKNLQFRYVNDPIFKKYYVYYSYFENTLIFEGTRDDLKQKYGVNGLKCIDRQAKGNRPICYNKKWVRFKKFEGN